MQDFQTFYEVMDRDLPTLGVNAVASSAVGERDNLQCSLVGQ